MFDIKANCSRDKALKIYGYGRQGAFGDVQGERPSMFDIAGQFKWDAWNERKGMPREEAQRKFLELVEPLLKENGISLADPHQKDIEDKYEKCVEHLKDIGISAEVIEQAKQRQLN